MRMMSLLLLLLLLLLVLVKHVRVSLLLLTIGCTWNAFVFGKYVMTIWNDSNSGSGSDGTQAAAFHHHANMKNKLIGKQVWEINSEKRRVHKRAQNIINSITSREIVSERAAENARSNGGETSTNGTQN